MKKKMEGEKEVADNKDDKVKRADPRIPETMETQEEER